MPSRRSHSSFRRKFLDLLIFFEKKLSTGIKFPRVKEDSVIEYFSSIIDRTNPRLVNMDCEIERSFSFANLTCRNWRKEYEKVVKSTRVF